MKAIAAELLRVARLVNAKGRVARSSDVLGNINAVVEACEELAESAEDHVQNFDVDADEAFQTEARNLWWLRDQAKRLLHNAEPIIKRAVTLKLI
jgi:hypothetical protein